MGLEYDYEKHVKKGKWAAFVRFCRVNSTDSYSVGCIRAVHDMLEDLSEGTKCGDVHGWAMKNAPGHGGASFGCCPNAIKCFSPRGAGFIARYEEKYGAC